MKPPGPMPPWATTALSILGLLVVLGGVFGGASIHMARRNEQVKTGDRHLEEESKALRALFRAERDDGTWRAGQALLAASREMVDHETARVSALSKVARENGVTIVSLESLAPDRSEDGRIVSCSHTLRGRGELRQVAAFMDGVYRVRGMAAIDQLSIGREEAPPNQLVADLRVTWHAPSEAGRTER